MKLSEEVAEKIAELEQENVNLRAGWAHDLRVVIAEGENSAKAAEKCLESLEE